MLFNKLTLGFPHNIWSKEIELDYIWTILLHKINYTREWGHILDVLLVYVTMTFDTQSCIKSTMDGDITMHELPRDGTVRTGWINAIFKTKKQQQQQKNKTKQNKKIENSKSIMSSYFPNGLLICPPWNCLPVLIKIPIQFW